VADAQLWIPVSAHASGNWNGAWFNPEIKTISGDQRRRFGQHLPYFSLITRDIAINHLLSKTSWDQVPMLKPDPAFSTTFRVRT
jgi:hypothetical protein